VGPLPLLGGQSILSHRSPGKRPAPRGTFPGLSNPRRAFARSAFTTGPLAGLFPFPASRPPVRLPSLPLRIFPLLAFLIASAALPALGLSRAWEANLARPGDFLFTGAEAGAAWDTSGLPYPAGDWRALYSASAEWEGLLRREGAATEEVASGRASQALWIRPEPMLALALTWSHDLERNRYAEPGKLNAALGGARSGMGMAAVYRLLDDGGADGGTEGGAFFDLGLAVPEFDRQGYSWKAAVGGRARWRLEYALERRDVDEPFSVENLDSSGGGEKVEGAYRARTLSHGVAAELPLAGGSLALSGAYAEGTPWRPHQEFWFTDSSRRVEAAARYARAIGNGSGRDWGVWSAHAAYREAEAISLGRRIPPGSDGVKRFHYARNHGQDFSAGVGRDPARPGPAGREPDGLSLGTEVRDYAWKSTPSPDALDARSETLSYNRLGLSFIANLYGGLFKESELVSGSFRASAWEVHGAWRFGIPVPSALGGRNRPLSASAGLSLYRTDFHLDWEGHSLSQRLLSVDTSAAYGSQRRGRLIGATPRLAADWTQGRFRMGLTVSQVVPLWLETHGPGSDEGEGAAAAAETRYPVFRNGFTAALRLEAGY
jgi:hypothetical protein